MRKSIVAYKCPCCKSYDTYLLNKDSELFCYCCGSQTRTHMQKLYVLRYKDRIKNWLGIVFFVLMFTVIPASFLIRTGEWKALVTNPRDYRTTVGVIVDTHVRRILTRSLFRGGYTYDVWYQYDVDGVQFLSRVVDFADHRGSYEVMFARTEMYMIGSQVIVYYLPDDPSFAALAPHIQDRPQGDLIAISIGIGIAILILVCAIIVPMYRYRPD